MAHFIDKSECAIHINGEHCTPKNILIDMAKKTNIINESSNNYKNQHDTKELIYKLKTTTNCSTELCVVEHFKEKSIFNNDLIDQIINSNFKIKGPKYDIKKWLSNEDIDNTLQQWQISHKHFYPIPFQMRDFEKQNTELATLDFTNLVRNGYMCFGCVPNTDYSRGSGQHWFALFFDFSKKPYTLEYFNSSGEHPLYEFDMWLDKTVESLRNRFNTENIDKIIVTRVQNQYDNSSCGCYSLYYIYSRLKNVPWMWFRQNRVPDEKMHEFRKFLFNPE